MLGLFDKSESGKIKESQKLWIYGKAKANITLLIYEKVKVSKRLVICGM